METSVRYLIGVSVGLYALFAAICYAVQVPALNLNHKASRSRLLVSERTVNRFVRELLAQSSPDYTESATKFYIGKVLLNYASDTSTSAYLLLPLAQQESWSLHQLCLQDHLLTPTDVVFMRQQMEAGVSFTVARYALPGYQFVPADSLRLAMRKAVVPLQSMQMMQRRYHTRSFFSVSAPLISQDGHTAIVEIRFTCGSTCGGGETWLLQRRRNLWHKVKLLGEWMS